MLALRSSSPLWGTLCSPRTLARGRACPWCPYCAGQITAFREVAMTGPLDHLFLTKRLSTLLELFSCQRTNYEAILPQQKSFVNYLKLNQSKSNRLVRALIRGILNVTNGSSLSKLPKGLIYSLINENTSTKLILSDSCLQSLVPTSTHFIRPLEIVKW